MNRVLLVEEEDRTYSLIINKKGCEIGNWKYDEYENILDILELAKDMIKPNEEIKMEVIDYSSVLVAFENEMVKNYGLEGDMWAETFVYYFSVINYEDFIFNFYISDEEIERRWDETHFESSQEYLYQALGIKVAQDYIQSHKDKMVDELLEAY